MIRDPIREGLAAGWRHIDAATLMADRHFEADVAIVGTGAGGGMAAEVLAAAGLQVILLEEGPLKSSSDFKMREADAYPDLYQESAGRKTADKAINILQGRCVGGSTTVNWTASFRTPPATLGYWQRHFGLQDLTAEALAPWFARVEERLHIERWNVSPNGNNDVLLRGAARLGIKADRLNRNVHGCWNLGYCGMGCPTNAKQSMLVTTLPAALARGATLVSRVRIDRLQMAGDQVTGLEGRALDGGGVAPSPYRVTVKARHVVLAAGAIGSPAVLLRSKAPDPHGLVGRRTFLHPTVISAAVFEQPIEGYAGAPLTSYSDHFLETHPINGPIGYKIEVPPLHPALMGTTVAGFGVTHAQMMQEFPHIQALIALLRDGFHPESAGGQVKLGKADLPVLHYPLTDYLFDGVRRAWQTMAEMQFAAGARKVYIVHEQATPTASWREAQALIAGLPLKPLLARVVSAHVMGGCGMASDAKSGVVDSFGRHYHLRNLHVFDGSVFPTSLGANPQLSIYGLVLRNATRLAAELTGKPVPAA